MAGLLTPAQQKKFFSGKLFKFIFGREANPKYDRPILVNYLASIEKTSPELLEKLLEDGLSNGQIEAIYETGIAPSEADFRSYPPTLVQVWLAIAYGENPQKSKVDRRLSPHVATDRYGVALTTIYAEINHTLIRLSHVIDTSVIVPGNNALDDLLFYYVSRTIQILRSIRVLINNDEGGMLVALSRNLFECFIQVKFLNERPDIARNLILPAMVDEKTLVFLRTSSGKMERRKVKDLQTGTITQTHYSIREILRLCKDTHIEHLYDAWYPELSSESHITSELLGDHFSGASFSIHRDVDDGFIMLNVGFAMALVTREIGISKTLSKRHSRDIQFGCKNVCKALRSVYGILAPHLLEEGPFEHIFKSMEILAESVLRKRPRE